MGVGLVHISIENYCLGREQGGLSTGQTTQIQRTVHPV